MLLCEKDIERIERLGYSKNQFVRVDNAGYARLRNKQEYCFFYDLEKGICTVYSRRPEGCRIYPVMLDESKGIVVDEICKSKSTVSNQEKAKNGLKVKKLLNRIDREAQNRERSNSCT
jgi:uncharacterized protein